MLGHFQEKLHNRKILYLGDVKEASNFNKHDRPKCLYVVLESKIGVSDEFWKKRKKYQRYWHSTPASPHRNLWLGGLLDSSSKLKENRQQQQQQQHKK